MAIFNVNQNRQFYVISEVLTDSTEPATIGQIKLGKTKDGKQIWFKHFGKGGLSRTDIIDVDNVCYAKESTKASMQRKLRKATVTLDSSYLDEGNPISGQDYVLRIQVNNYLAPGDACVLIKSAAVHAVKGMTAAEATCNPGGVIIIASSCNDGHGGEAFYRTFADEPDNEKIMAQFLATPQEETIPDQWESQILCRILLKHKLIMVSDAPEQMIRDMHMDYAHNLDEAIAMADAYLAEQGKTDSKITVIPDGIAVIVNPAD